MSIFVVVVVVILVAVVVVVIVNHRTDENLKSCFLVFKSCLVLTSKLKKTFFAAVWDSNLDSRGRFVAEPKKFEASNLSQTVQP